MAYFNTLDKPAHIHWVIFRHETYGLGVIPKRKTLCDARLFGHTITMCCFIHEHFSCSFSLHTAVHEPCLTFVVIGWLRSTTLPYTTGVCLRIPFVISRFNALVPWPVPQRKLVCLLFQRLNEIKEDTHNSMCIHSIHTNARWISVLWPTCL